MEKKNRGLIITVVFLTICILGLSGYLVYDKVLNKENTKGNKTVETNKNDSESNNLTKQDMAEIGSQLYKIISANYAGIDYPFFNESLLTYESLDNDVKMQITFALLDSNMITNNKVSNLGQCLDLDAESSSKYVDCVMDSGSSSEPMDCVNYYPIKQFVDAKCIERSVSKVDFESVYYKIFGNNKPIEYVSFNPYDSIASTCDLYNENIMCYPINGGDDTYGTQQFINYKDIKELDNNIVLSVDFLAIQYNIDDDHNGVYSSPEVVMCDTDNYKGGCYNIANRIDNIEYYNSLQSNDFASDLFSHYKNNSGKYEVTFKQDSNGNWYWFSTKLVK